MGDILRRRATEEVCTEPNLKVLLRCFLSKDKEVLSQVANNTVLPRLAIF